MSADPRVRSLLEEILESHRTPEEVCRACPELLPEVRHRLRRLRELQAQVDSLLPTTGSATGPSAPLDGRCPQVRGYEVQAMLGRGGMGVVYEALHVRLNRVVALKMLQAGAYAGAHERARFQREAEVVAELRHPNIVQVYDVGEHEGCPFFTMELLEGGSLAQAISGTPQPARQAAALLAKLAEAVQVAHQGGIVHRDLKPANILLTPDGTPKIADFGLARHFDEGQALTLSGTRLGTPSYVAPEQVIGKAGRIGPAADIYALGVLLYEVLTGRPPFRGETAAETERQVIHDEPVSPSRLNPKVPRDLDTICLKCLSKEPARRYASAGDLAEDLWRFLDGRPIVARPVPFWERGIKWARRRPAIAALISAVLLLLTSLLGGGVWSYAEINRSLTKAESLAQAEATAKALAQEQTKIANQRAEDLVWEDYINRVDRAYREVQDDNVALAEDLLHGCPVERRGWEWHYVKRLCHPERFSLEATAGSLSAIAFSPDGRLIATGSGGQFYRGKGGSTVEFWDRDTGQRLPTLHGTENVVWGLAFSPDGTELALGGTNPQVEVRDAHTGAVRWSKHEPTLPQAMSIAFSPDGKALAVGFGQYSQQEAFLVKVYEVKTGRETAAFPGPRGGVNDLAFHPDGRHLAVAGAEVVEVWDVGARRGSARSGGIRNGSTASRIAPTGNGWPPAAGTARSSSGMRPPARRS